MKSIKIDSRDVAREYPRLMVGSGGSIVLMVKYAVGTVVYAGGSHSLGTYKTDWVMFNFKDYEGTLQLSN